MGLRVQHLLRDEEGAQVVEYALIIAVVSIALVLAIQAWPAAVCGLHHTSHELPDGHT
jgi:Flp pilus assembly pilin Flp